MSLLDAIQDSEAVYARGLKEGVAIGKREQAIAVAELLAEVMNIARAKRYDRAFFDDDSAFADWAQSRCRQHCPPQFEWHDDKPDERADRHISTGPSDLGADGKPIIRRA